MSTDYMYAPHCAECGIRVGAPRLVPEDYKPVRTLCFTCPGDAKPKTATDLWGAILAAAKGGMPLDEMRDKLEEMARRADSSQHHAWLAVVILSHGRRRRGEDEVMGVNGEGITRTQIVDMFTVNCPNFQNKPKFFWIQVKQESI